ncbi:MAG: DUF4956 domain-containing protein [Erysipelotrichaceae bacterium]|nr:DUF4956 domain-containing protein [Erysipelotrichaceae bacterium]MBR2701930.1 DUF4956 domain-containing protein [Erysipelotrichaceae bacterium]
MLTSIFHIGSFDLYQVLSSMLCALVLGVIISTVYKYRLDYASKFIIVLAVMPALISFMIMVINGNLGISVAVLGAFGLVRFRSAPGSSKDIAYMFFSVAIGLATGLGFLSLAVLVCAVISIMLLIMEFIHFDCVETRNRLLRITIPEDLEYPGLFDDLFMKYTSTHSFERVKTVNMGTMFELSYKIELRDLKKEKEFIDSLRCRNGNLGIVISKTQREKNEL